MYLLGAAFWSFSWSLDANVLNTVVMCCSDEVLEVHNLNRGTATLRIEGFPALPTGNSKGPRVHCFCFRELAQAQPNVIVALQFYTVERRD